MSSTSEIYFKNDECILPNSSIIIGCVSHGNIGQMAADCLLATSFILGTLKKIGGIFSDHLYPISGYESYSKQQFDAFLCSSIEIHEIKLAKPVYVVLVRSLCMAGKAEALAKDLIKILSAYTPSSLILLTGASTEDVELSDKRSFYYSSVEESLWQDAYPILPSYLDSLQQLNLPYTPVCTRPVVLSYSHDEISTAPYGMILAKQMIHHLSQSASKSIPLLVLGKFIEEGDNMNDALEFASHLCYGLGITPNLLSYDEVNQPQSWKIRLYGKSKSNRSDEYPMLY